MEGELGQRDYLPLSIFGSEILQPGASEIDNLRQLRQTGVGKIQLPNHL